MKKNFLIFLLTIVHSAYSQITCNNWLNTPARYSYVDIGKLDVPGDQITVEAVINRTTPYQPGTGNNTEGDIVSKHDNPDDVNYLLRPNHAYITTNNGFFATPDIADIELNKTYHVAMVYDGTTLKFYRDGCLMSEVAASGNLYQNNWDTRIGYYQDQIWNTNFIGYINEVRIWNVARTQSQIQAYMNTSLPNPTTQTGLLAYYTFDNLINKQGNAAWNGTLGGSASINQTNSNCNSIDNTCIATGQNCNSWLSTPSAPSSVRIGQLNIPGDKVTVEALINRTAPYYGGQLYAGDIVSKHREPTDVNYLLRPNSGEITTTNGYFKTPNIADIQLNKTYHVAMVYDGATLKFYRDGCLMSQIAASGNLFQNSWETAIGYFSPQLDPNEAFIGYINEVRIWNVARTQAQIQAYMNTSLPNPTIQPGLLAYYTFDNLINKQGNAAWNGTLNGGASINQTNTYCNSIDNICAINCNINITKSADTSLCGSSPVSIFATGGTSYSWFPITGLSNSGISNPVATPLSSTKYYVTVTNDDGCTKMDSVNIIVNQLPVVSISNDTSICKNTQANLFATGGTSYSWSPVTALSNPGIANPVATPVSSTKYYVTVTNDNGCTKKDSVNIVVNQLPVVSISNDTSICKNTEAHLLVTGGSSYTWTPTSSLSDPGIANPIASPAVTTAYSVVVTNDDGCMKTASVQVEVKPSSVISASADSTICNKTSVQLFVTGGSSYIWSPSASLDNAVRPNPVASPDSTTMYHVKITDANLCEFTDSVKITVRPAAVFSVSPDNSVCANTSQQLSASGGDTYLWSPASFLDNANVNNPITTPGESITYSVTIKENTCNETATLFTKLTVFPSPNVRASVSNDITCSLASATLSATGARDYTWNPSSNLNNPNISSPVATPTATTLYTVTGKDANGCTGSDTVSVKVFFNGNALYLLPNSFTPNGDGLNDCFGIAYWGRVDQLEFSIYNRFGEKVFHTNNSAMCWDGTYKGRSQDAGAFVYVIKAKTVCGNINRKGTVILIR